MKERKKFENGTVHYYQEGAKVTPPPPWAPGPGQYHICSRCSETTIMTITSYSAISHTMIIKRLSTRLSICIIHTKVNASVSLWLCRITIATTKIFNLPINCSPLTIIFLLIFGLNKELQQWRCYCSTWPLPDMEWTQCDIGTITVWCQPFRGICLIGRVYHEAHQFCKYIYHTLLHIQLLAIRYFKGMHAWDNHMLREGYSGTPL